MYCKSSDICSVVATLFVFDISQLHQQHNLSIRYIFLRNEVYCLIMSKELLENYRKDIENVKKSAKKLGLTDNEIESIFKRSLIDLQNDISSNFTFFAKIKKYSFYSIKWFIVLFAIVSFIYILLNVHQPTSSIVLRNVQGLIYPGLKFVRYLSVPIITLFPSLTGTKKMCSFLNKNCLIN